MKIRNLKINSLTKTIIGTSPNKLNITPNHVCVVGRNSFYFKRTNSANSKLKTLALFMFKEFKYLRFITLTTVQHKTCALDWFLMKQFGYFAKHYCGKFYLCSVERQRNTGDIHYHIITTSDFNQPLYSRMRKKWAKLIGAKDHRALFQCEIVKNGEVAMYVSKLANYVSKNLNDIDEEKPPYSSLFFCRTYSVSKSLHNLFKQKADNYILSVKDNYLDYLMVNHKLKEKFANDFFVQYYYEDYIWLECLARYEIEKQGWTNVITP